MGKQPVDVVLTPERRMRRLHVAFASAVLAAAVAATSAQAQQLAASSTGLDWLAADASQRVAWSLQIARLFNKEDAFGEAVEVCLSEGLADRDDVDLSVLNEMRQGDLPMLTAGCVLSLGPHEAPSH